MKISDFINEGVQKVAIVGHVHPDGDCAGAVTAFYAYLKKKYPNLSVTPYLAETVDSLNFLKAGIPIDETEGNNTNYDICFSLDVSSVDRFGAGEKAFQQAKHTVCIDHHVTNPGIADENIIIPNASSTCEVLCMLFEGEELNYQIAVSLYTGIIHDCGVFRFDCTSRKTMEYAAKLLDYDIPFDTIIQKSFVEVPYRVKKIAAQIVLDSTFVKSDNFLYAICPMSMQQEFKVFSKDLGSVVAELNTIESADTVLFCYELVKGEWKGSLRSKGNVDVAAISMALGGGGHKRAAGFSFQEDPIAIVKKVSEMIKDRASGS